MACLTIYHYILFLVFGKVVIAAPSPWDPRPHISLYDHENHKGQSYHQDVGRKCYNIPSVFDDRASSLDTHYGCVKVCTERNCRGCYEMRPGTKGHHSLKEIHLNDNISSFTQCAPEIIL